jgi:hypothetical protein
MRYAGRVLCGLGCVAALVISEEVVKVEPKLVPATPEIKIPDGRIKVPAAKPDGKLTIPAAALQEPPSIPQSSAPVHDLRADGQSAGGAEQFASCESGGEANPWTAENSETGAYGKYQIMPLHYETTGVCSDLGKSPGEQTECAARVFKSQGSGAWSECGG